MSYHCGNNEKYVYKIIDLKEDAIETKVSKDSLVYKLCGETFVKISKFSELPFGNFDLVLEQRKTNDFNGLILATFDEIEIIE